MVKVKVKEEQKGKGKGKGKSKRKRWRVSFIGTPGRSPSPSRTACNKVQGISCWTPTYNLTICEHWCHCTIQCQVSKILLLYHNKRPKSNVKSSVKASLPFVWKKKWANFSFFFCFPFLNNRNTSIAQETSHDLGDKPRPFQATGTPPFFPECLSLSLYHLELGNLAFPQVPSRKPPPLQLHLLTLLLDTSCHPHHKSAWSSNNYSFVQDK